MAHEGLAAPLSVYKEDGKEALKGTLGEWHGHFVLALRLAMFDEKGFFTARMNGCVTCQL